MRDHALSNEPQLGPKMVQAFTGAHILLALRTYNYYERKTKMPSMMTVRNFP
jgi:hypothetical protein